MCEKFLQVPVTPFLAIPFSAYLGEYRVNGSGAKLKCLTLQFDIVVCRSDDFADGKEGDQMMSGFGSGGKNRMSKESR